MIRRIITIDEEKCNGCGACASACHEGAIGMVDGKARLLKDDYCDGLGDCLPACPTGAISFEEREAAAYDEAAVKARMAARAVKSADSQDASQAARPPFAGCPGSMSRVLRSPDTKNRREETGSQAKAAVLRPAPDTGPAEREPSESASCLSQWPVQIKLAPITAPYFDGAKLLIAADCTAFAYGSFHQDFIRGKVTLIGCPKLDAVNYAEKLTEIIRQNELKSITVVRMEVPCCGGIEQAVKQSLAASGKMIPWQVVTISVDGQILE